MKLDRALVSDADTDPVRVALAEMLGEFAGRIDAWLLAEGIETAAELAAFARLGVPLAQGWLLGRPAPGFAPLAPEVDPAGRAPRSPAPGSPTAWPACCARSASTPSASDVPGVPPLVLVGPQGEPVALLLADPRTGGGLHRPGVAARAPLRPTSARPCSGRSPGRRPSASTPSLCTDPTGDVLGLLRIEDLAVRRPEGR